MDGNRQSIVYYFIYIGQVAKKTPSAISQSIVYNFLYMVKGQKSPSALGLRANGPSWFKEAHGLRLRSIKIIWKIGKKILLKLIT